MNIQAETMLICMIEIKLFLVKIILLKKVTHLNMFMKDIFCKGNIGYSIKAFIDGGLIRI